MAHNQYTPKEECSGKALHFRLKDELHKQIEAECQRRGVTRTEWLIEAVGWHLVNSSQLPNAGEGE
jgi:predicted HicB family RNase H-like nuclease